MKTLFKNLAIAILAILILIFTYWWHVESPFSIYQLNQKLESQERMYP